MRAWCSARHARVLKEGSFRGAMVCSGSRWARRRLKCVCGIDFKLCVGGSNADGKAPQMGCEVGSILAHNVHWARIAIGHSKTLIQEWECTSSTAR